MQGGEGGGGGGGGGGAPGTSQSQATTMRNVAEEQAQAQLNINISLDVDFTDMRLNDPGAIGGTPGDLIRSGREAQAAEAETDDQFDERVSSSPSIDDGGFGISALHWHMPPTSKE